MVLEEALDGFSNPSIHVLLGPVVWNEDDRGIYWYFTIMVGDERSSVEIARCEKESTAQLQSHGTALTSNERGVVELGRGALLAELTRRKCMIHDFDDEIEMARMAVDLWPSDKTRSVYDQVKAERHSAAKKLH